MLSVTLQVTPIYKFHGKAIFSSRLSATKDVLSMNQHDYEDAIPLIQNIEISACSESIERKVQTNQKLKYQ